MSNREKDMEWLTKIKKELDDIYKELDILRTNEFVDRYLQLNLKVNSYNYEISNITNSLANYD